MSLTTQEQAVFDQLAAKAAATPTEEKPLGLAEILTNIARTVGREHLIKHIENLSFTPASKPAPAPSADEETSGSKAGGK